MATSYTIGNKFVFLTCALLALPLAACQHLSGGFDTAAGGPAMTAATVPTVPVDNPFWCLGARP